MSTGLAARIISRSCHEDWDNSISIWWCARQPLSFLFLILHLFMGILFIHHIKHLAQLHLLFILFSLQFCSPFILFSIFFICTDWVLMEWAIHSPWSSSSHLFPSFFPSYPLLLSLLPLSLSQHLSLYLFCPLFLFPLLLLNSLSLAYMAYM